MTLTQAQDLVRYYTDRYAITRSEVDRVALVSALRMRDDVCTHDTIERRKVGHCYYAIICRTCGKTLYHEDSSD